MALPPLLKLAGEADYRAHFAQSYCHAPILTFDGIPIRFQRVQFDHAFFESSQRNGIKDSFSPMRAERIDWIKAAIEDPAATLLKGWDKGKKQYDDARRVAVVYVDFVVVVRMSLAQAGSLTGKFVTCYKADNSIGKIMTSPLWSKEDCIAELGGGP